MHPACSVKKFERAVYKLIAPPMVKSMSFFNRTTWIIIFLLALGILSLVAAGFAVAGEKANPSHAQTVQASFTEAASLDMKAAPLLAGDVAARVHDSEEMAVVRSLQANVVPAVTGKVVLTAQVSFRCAGDEMTYSVAQDQPLYHWMEAGESYSFELPELAPMSCEQMGAQGNAQVESLLVQASLAGSEGQITHVSAAELKLNR